MVHSHLRTPSGPQRAVHIGSKPVAGRRIVRRGSSLMKVETGQVEDIVPAERIGPDGEGVVERI